MLPVVWVPEGLPGSRDHDVGIAEAGRSPPLQAWPTRHIPLISPFNATFLNRAFDQLLMDVAAQGGHRLSLIERGPAMIASHNGVWDIAMWLADPGALHPRRETRFARPYAKLDVSDAPTVLRYLLPC